MSLRSEFAGVVLKICKLTHRQHTQASKWTRGLTLSLHEKQALWWLFYLDKSNVIQNIYSRGNPTDWQRGNIGSKRYTVPAQSSIAFEEDDRWSDGSVFPNTDGHGGASVWSLNSYAYLFTLRNTQTIDLWWQDYNSQSVDRNSWQLGPSSHAVVMANASMCGQFAFAYQGAKEWIQGNNFTGTRPELVR
ncbi:hypothetical protein BDFG_02547 [Blastomyces dermatitidis ATCC 26199]|nr:hypothetical protein BDFG_02547 [Blastomyces dermatitidis ATCC 26199]